MITFNDTIRKFIRTQIIHKHIRGVGRRLYNNVEFEFELDKRVNTVNGFYKTIPSLHIRSVKKPSNGRYTISFYDTSDNKMPLITFFI